MVCLPETFCSLNQAWLELRCVLSGPLSGVAGFGRWWQRQELSPSRCKAEPICMAL